MTSIIAEQPTTGLPKATTDAITAIQARIDGLTDIAHFLRTNPDLPGMPQVYEHAVLVCLNSLDQPADALAEWTRRATTAGADVSAIPDSGIYAGAKLRFGQARIEVYARAELVEGGAE